MFFSTFDLILLGLTLISVTIGFVLGFIQAIGALVGIGLGTWLAGQWYGIVAQWLSHLPFMTNQNLARVAAFVLVFAVVNRLVGLIFYLVDKIFGLLSFIPFTKLLNRLLGGLLGFVEAALGLGVVLYFAKAFPVSAWLTASIAQSKIAPTVIEIASWLRFLLPVVLQQLR